MIARQRLTNQRMERTAAGQGGKRSDWSSVVRGGSAAPQSAEVDYDLLADKVADRLAMKLAQQNGAFLKAAATVLNGLVHEMMKQMLTPIRNRIEDVYDGLPMLGAPHAPEQDRAGERRSMEMDGPASARRLRMEDTAEELAERMTQHAARFRSNQQAFSEQAQYMYMQQPMAQQVAWWLPPNPSMGLWP